MSSPQDTARKLAAIAADERTPEHERTAAAMALAKLVAKRPEALAGEPTPAPRAPDPGRPSRWEGIREYTYPRREPSDREQEAAERAREDAHRRYVDVDPETVREQLRRRR